jgi:hypothetical protein
VTDCRNPDDSDNSGEEGDVKSSENYDKTGKPTSADIGATSDTATAAKSVTG